MEARLTVRFLDRPGNPALVLSPRVARRLIRARWDGSYICSVTEDGGYTVDLLDARTRLAAGITEVWLLPKGQCRPARSPIASAA